jgi:uncharacterized protein YjiS (DUF1127 family)
MDTSARFMTTMAPARTSRTFRQWFDSCKARLAQWHERARSRRELRLMTERELWDIGFSRTEASNEVRKPFWLR